MKINQKLLEKQIKTLSKQLNKKLSPTERAHIEGLLNMLGDLSDTLKGPGEPSPKILIEVSGGNVQRVLANRDADIVIVDHDNIDQGQNPIASIQGPDLINAGRDIHELFTDVNDPREMDIKNQLKRIKF